MHNSDKQILVKTFCRPRHLVSSRGPDWVLSFETTRVQWNCGPTGDVGPNFKQWREGSLGHFCPHLMWLRHTWGCPVARPAWRESGPWPKTWFCKGHQNPHPLRSALKPLGLDGLSAFHQAKVDRANKLYALAIQI